MSPYYPTKYPERKKLTSLTYFLALALFLSAFLSCESTTPVQQARQQQTASIPASNTTSQQQATSNPTGDTSSPQQAVPASQYWTGNGGKGMTLAVLEPGGNGLTADELRWMPSMVQGSITGDFNRFSAMTIIDRQNLEKILDEQGQSMSGNYSDDDFISIGRLTNARYILAGSITRTASAYMLELAVTDVESGERKASYPPTQVSSQALENLSAVKEASADLLGQLGVSLTSRGKQELSRTADPDSVQAEMALARGITAQRQGAEVEALSYFLRANSYDPGLEEAEKRLEILSTSIASGNVGENARNDIAWRNQWIARLRETENFFVNYTKEGQPYYLLYNTDIKQGAVNYQNETVELSFQMSLVPDPQWVLTMNEVILAVENGLLATGRAATWGLYWPDNVVTSPSPFADKTNNFMVAVEIMNDQGRSLGRQSITIPYGYIVRYGTIIPKQQWEGTVTIPAVDVKLITDNLTVRIISIDGAPAETAANQKKISIMPSEEFRQISRPGGLAADESLFSVKDDGTLTGYTGTQTNVVIPSIIKGVYIITIGDNAFNKKGLTRVTIPNGIRIIGNSTFYYNQLTGVTIPNSVRSISDDAFHDNKLTSVIIPNSVISIGVQAFYNNQLTSIIIPDSVTSIGWNAFVNNNLNSITIGTDVNMGSSPSFDSGFDHFYSQNGKKAGTYRGNNNNWTYSPR